MIYKYDENRIAPKTVNQVMHGKDGSESIEGIFFNTEGFVSGHEETTIEFSLLEADTQYEVFIVAKDEYENTTNIKTLSVKTSPEAPEGEKPVIELIGDEVVNVDYNSTFKDAGATITDNKDINLNVIVTYSRLGADLNGIDTTMPGEYLVHYNVIDSDGNAADEVIRTVIVKEPIGNVLDPEFEEAKNELIDKVIFENDIRTFTLYAFMNFTGYDDENNDEGFLEVRKRVRDDLNAMNLNLSDNNYFTNKGVRYSRYKEALACLGSAPEFNPIAKYNGVLTDLGSKLKEFYEKANIEQLYEKYKPYYDKELNKYEGVSLDAIANTNRFLRIENSEISKFYIQVNLLDAYERGSGLGLIDNYRETGVITVGPSYDINIRNVVHEYLHGIVNPIAESIEKDDENTIESIIRALVIHIVDKPEEKQDMIDYEMNRGFTRTQYIFEQLQQYESYQGSFKDFISMILK